MNPFKFCVILSSLSVTLIQPPAYSQYRRNKPEFNYSDLKGTMISSKIFIGKPLMIVYFNPSCDVCAEETKTIKKEITYFKDKNIVFISPHELDSVKKFVEHHGLEQFEFITILRDEVDPFYKNFESPGFPSIYLYNQKLEYLNSLHGYADILEIKSSFEHSPQKIKKKKVKNLR